MANFLCISLGLLLLSLHGTPPCSATNDTLTAGAALAVGDRLVSSNGRFTLGFFQPSFVSKSGINITSPGWYVGIWFSNISEFTTVWVANRDNPITELRLNQTQLKLSGDGNLVISSNASIIWSTNIVNKTAATINTTSAILSNDGNLVIGNSSASNVLWQSFDNPSDALLPGAKFGWNKLTNVTRKFISKKNLIDPGLGLYYVELDNTGIVLSRSNPYKMYWSWSSEKSSNQLIDLLNQLININPQTKGRIRMAYVNNDEEEYYQYILLDESYYVYVLLDISGQIEINVWSQDKQSWQQVYAQPADPCTAYATCGPFTICNGIAKPFCNCMESFSQRSPQDWELDNRTAGCSRNTPLDCGNTTSSTDVFHAISRVALPTNNPQNVDNATSQNQCAQACLSYCSCNAYSYVNNRCSIYRGDLLSVNSNDGIDNTSEDVLYLRLAAKDMPSSSKNKRKSIVGVVTAASIICFVLVMLMLFLLILRKKLGLCGAQLHDSQCSGGIVAFRYGDLCHATKNFSEKLGGGGFGSVFKGVLSDSTIIAVKKLDGARQGEKQFRAEVSSIGLIQHINLVKLIGFCCEGDERLLVYEHMVNGSLDVHLFQSKDTVLNWTTRYNLAIGVARGLSYLHHSCNECIIHCDIKPENILLDASFAPKIADFGMAAFVGRNFSRVLTTFRGTIGYLAPEWISGVAVTPKVDVYSFGMVLLEILSGRRNSHKVHNDDDSDQVAFFPVQAISKLHEGDVQSLVDPQLNGDFIPEEAERVCKLACWCIQENEYDRPTMNDVVRVLEGLQELDMPPMPRLLAALIDCSVVAHRDDSS
ncbi:G-type lectin S-receptor-like serine/threonine-protein kinase At2g19130 [Oryza brachyantha]|uniref:Receptor-like serine/threonine-protein kinase n=1 Tax=Oryza brachyantha TaxID=4533 RepID=J3M4A7_ORYBR|nr:G-type lectin S-receptor-like serine/threonine-protein kinase At2g19130 [Oryza brachyantha]